nr:PREDICTED: mas-related G-protein coupled receptor member A2-like [Anolis carolinensis]|eukprot:XP_016848285.1 PREDICTED: mas-related G-protein coupled receptor member A2-like [Anolis carolinensis]
MADSNLSLRTLPNPEMWYNGTENEAVLPSVVIFLTTIMALSTSLLGFVGNGIVFWLLGFCIKRNPFTTYVLNLAIADFGVVTAIVAINTIWLAQLLTYVDMHHFSIIFFNTLFRFMFSTSQCLLSLISIDRCVCVFFPFWHRCHRPPYLSPTLCAVIWIFNFLFLFSDIVLPIIIQNDNLSYYLFFLNTVVCTSLMTICTVALLIKICIISPQYKRGKLLTVILLTLLFFLFFTFPMNAIQYFSDDVPLLNDPYYYEYAFLGAYINSTVNPLIYFLIGKEKRDRSGEKVKKILARLFTENENDTEEMKTSVQTQL